MAWGTIISTLGQAAQAVGTKAGETALATGIKAAGEEGMKKALMKALESGAEWAVTETGEKLTEEGIKALTKEGLQQVISKGGEVATKAVAKEGGKKIALEVGTKVGTKVASEAIQAKATPDEEKLTKFGLNDLLSYYLTGQSIAASFIPGVGTLASLGISGLNTAMKMATDAQEAKANLEELTKKKSAEMKQEAIQQAKQGLLQKTFGKLGAMGYK